MPRPINIVLIYKDAKGGEAQSLINIENQDEESDISQQIAAAVQHQLDIDALTEAQIIRCGVLIDVPLHGSLKTSPVANSDLEAGALFIFKADNNFSTQTRIPAFAESKFVTASPEVDLTDSDVQDFVTNMLDGYNSLDVQTSRGEDVVILASSKKDFEKSRV